MPTNIPSSYFFFSSKEYGYFKWSILYCSYSGHSVMVVEVFLLLHLKCTGASSEEMFGKMILIFPSVPV